VSEITTFALRSLAIHAWKKIEEKNVNVASHVYLATGIHLANHSKKIKRGKTRQNFP
jgi:hypothetical protein